MLAIRDGTPNFELVGMASSAAARESRMLVPDNGFKTENKPMAPYDGDIFIDNNKLISYGVTYSVSIDEIINLVLLLF